MTVQLDSTRKLEDGAARRFARKAAFFVALSLASLASSGCIIAATAAVIATVVALNQPQEVTLTAVVEKDADRLFAALRTAAQDRYPEELAVVRDDAETRDFESERLGGDGEKVRIAFTTTQLDEGASELRFVYAVDNKGGETVSARAREMLADALEQLDVQWRFAFAPVPATDGLTPQRWTVANSLTRNDHPGRRP